MKKQAKTYHQINDQEPETKSGKSIFYRLNIMLELAGQHQKILDLGSKDGTFIKLLEKQKNKVIGLEISRKAVALAKKNNCHMIRHDLTKRFPFPKNSFDIVTAGEIIEHLYDTDFFLSEIARVLKNQGSLVISTPNIASLGRRFLLLFGLNPLIEINAGQSSAGHIRYFTFRNLKQLLEKHNFKTTQRFSDLVNFSQTIFYIRSTFLARHIPSFGASIIIKAQINK